MNNFIYMDFNAAINAVKSHLLHDGYPVITETWQASKNPPEFFEALNVSFSALIPQKLDSLRKQIGPNLPWADDHFKERVGGQPLNPGEQYKNWPFYKNNPANDTSRNVEGGKFSHTYMERMWPKNARPGLLTSPTVGIRYYYGDLESVVKLLKNQPYTRQAYLPIWFPEDTGAVAGQRVPCTLGYHFIKRGELLHVTYYIRSCDFFRHFRDDIYLCCLLVEWLLLQLKVYGGEWDSCKPGIFSMHITSLHIFYKEKNLLKD